MEGHQRGPGGMAGVERRRGAKLEEEEVGLLCKVLEPPSHQSLSAVRILGVGSPQNPASLGDLSGDEYI